MRESLVSFLVLFCLILHPKMMLMKSIATFVGFVVALLGPSVRAEKEWVDIKLGLDELEILGTDFGNIVLETVEDILNDLELKIDPPIQIGVPGICPRGVLAGEVSNFVLRELNDGDVSFAVAENPNNPTRSAMVFLSLKDLTFDVFFDATITWIFASCPIPIVCPCINSEDCGFQPSGTIGIEEIGLGFMLTIGEDGLTFTIDLEPPQLDSEDLAITLALNIAATGVGAICPVIEFLDDSAALINAIIDFILNTFDIAEVIIDAIVAAIPPISYTLPEPLVQLPVLPGGTFALSLFITTLQGDPEFLRTRFTTNFKSTLTLPSWRDGNSYSPELTDTPLPEVGSDSQLNINVGASGLNAGFASAWYLLWSTLATDEASKDSSLCQAGENDPCLFPPIIETFDKDNNPAVFKTLNSFFFGLFESINVSFVIPPAELDFTKKNTLEGMATGEVLLEGTNSKKSDVFLIKLTVSVFATSTIPQLDTEDRMFCCWQIKVMVGKPNVESFNPIYAVNAITLQSLAIVIQKIIQSFINPVIAEVNEQIEEALDGFTFEWPVIPIPGEDKGIEISLTSDTNAVTVVPAKGIDEQAVVQLTGGVMVEVVDNPFSLLRSDE